jgi:uncharacterized protein YggE
MKIAVPALIAAAAAAVLAAGCAGEEGSSSSSGVPPAGSGGDELAALAAQSPAPESSASGRGITVTGSGTAKTAPDVAEWSFGVQASAGTAEVALADASAAMETVLEALGSAGIDGEDLRTEQVSIYPAMSPDGRSVQGYDASNTVHAVVRDLSRSGAVVDAAVRAGANQVYGPTLRVSDTRDAYRTAVAEAFADARARAEAIAAESGLQLGGPVAVVEGGGGGVIPYAADRAVADAEAAAVPIEPGLNEIGASLTVTFSVS